MCQTVVWLIVFLRFKTDMYHFMLSPQVLVITLSFLSLVEKWTKTHIPPLSPDLIKMLIIFGKVLKMDNVSFNQIKGLPPVDFYDL